MKPNIAILITSHNRKKKTLGCLDALYKQSLPFDVFFVDDGSTDGTREAIRKQYPQINLIQGTGELYWNQGMRLAWETAINRGGYDFYVWLNDDTILKENALRILLDSFKVAQKRTKQDAIIVGSTQDILTGKLTYGGRVIYNKINFLASKLVLPGNEIKPINTFNGNIVLVPQSVVSEIGILDKSFQHGFGDMDYGLRANKKNIPIFIAPGFLGYCSSNTIVRDWTNPKVPFKQRYKSLNSPLGLPLKQWKIYVKRHAGIYWPIMYLKLVFRVCCPALWTLKNRK